MMEVLSNSVCRSCRAHLRTTTLPIRTFSTTSTRSSIPPESPVYIDVPQTFQADLPYHPPQKGILPVARELFPANRLDKTTKEYLDALTPSPLPKNTVPYDALSKEQQYKHRMSTLRKQHIREGLTELAARKVATQAKAAKRSRQRGTERARLMTQAPREDTRLTSPSVPTAMRLTKSSTPIADELAAAKAFHAQKVANYNAHAAAKQEVRMDAVHTLYMNARNFITTEAQLEAAIEEAFDERNFRSEIGSGKSMWNLGVPDTVRTMVANSQARDNGLTMVSGLRGNTAAKFRFKRAQDRLQQIAEKLSGGKI